MSAPSQTKIFGVRVGVDPKILIGILVAVALLLYWYNSRSDDGGTTSTAAPASGRTDGSAPAQTAATRQTLPSRRTQAASDRGVLRLRPVDASRGDIDPTLRLDLLARLRSVELGKIGRSVFESATQAAGATLPQIKNAPKIPVLTAYPPVNAAPPVLPAVNVPLKYYGYVKPQEKSEANRGLFLDTENNVVVAVEGQVVKGHYMVVELTPTNARMEDTTLKQGQTLPVMPLAATNQ